MHTPEEAIDELTYCTRQLGLKVAMLTGSDRLDGVDSDAVIPKPFTIEQLTMTVANLAR